MKTIDVKTGKEIASCRFHMESSREAKLKSARIFVGLFRKNLAK